MTGRSQAKGPIVLLNEKDECEVRMYSNDAAVPCVIWWMRIKIA